MGKIKYRGRNGEVKEIAYNPIENRYEDMKFTIEAASGGKNTVVLDNAGLPSIVTVIPRFNMSDVVDGAPNTPHPMFIVNGVTVNAIGISKYQNVVINGRAYSLPYKDPANLINFDNAKAACTAKGGTWHLMSEVEWSGVALWSKKNNTMPRGNNNYGKDHLMLHERGVESSKADATQTGRVFTGSGPRFWTHDQTESGIYDMNGNVWEWTDGMKVIDGILHLRQNNNYADLESSWINTGVNIINGLTSGQIISTLRSGTIPNTTMDFRAFGIPATMGSETGFLDDRFYFSDSGERVSARGANWSDTTRAGIFALSLSYPRTTNISSIGFRSAVVL